MRPIINFLLVSTCKWELGFYTTREVHHPQHRQRFSDVQDMHFCSNLLFETPQQVSILWTPALCMTPACCEISCLYSKAIMSCRTSFAPMSIWDFPIEKKLFLSMWQWVTKWMSSSAVKGLDLGVSTEWFCGGWNQYWCPNKLGHFTGTWFCFEYK